MRFEYKYLVPNFQLPELRRMVLPFVGPDKFAARQPGCQYTVRSIYFDTPNFEMYHTKRDHQAHRMKVRLRGYNLGGDDASVFFEIKRKYEGPIVKNRATLAFSTVQKMFAGASVEAFLPELNGKADNVRRFFYQMYSRRLQSVVNVIYEREAYLSKVNDPDNDMRLTFDKNLRSVPFPTINELYSERDLQYPIAGHFILEVKFNRYCPAWIKPVLATLNLQKAPASKYVLCVDSQPSLRPDRSREMHYQSSFLRSTA